MYLARPKATSSNARRNLEVFSMFLVRLFLLWFQSYHHHHHHHQFIGSKTRQSLQFHQQYIAHSTADRNSMSVHSMMGDSRPRGIAETSFIFPHRAIQFSGCHSRNSSSFEICKKKTVVGECLQSPKRLCL